MNSLTPTELANTVTAFATVFSGLTCMALCALVAPQPRRWVAVYGAVFLTGLPTVWYHGFGETNLSGWADSSSNLLLAWLIIVAALWDGYSRRVSWGIGVSTGLVNLIMIMIRGAAGADVRHVDVMPLGEFGGFHITESVLILDSFLGVGLIYGRFKSIPNRARPLLYTVTAIFLLGMVLASASNHQLDYLIVSYHALWHVLGAFGFVFLWAFNHVRWHASRV